MIFFWQTDYSAEEAQDTLEKASYASQIVNREEEVDRKLGESLEDIIEEVEELERELDEDRFTDALEAHNLS